MNVKDFFQGFRKPRTHTCYFCKKSTVPANDPFISGQPSTQGWYLGNCKACCHNHKLHRVETIWDDHMSSIIGYHLSIIYSSHTYLISVSFPHNFTTIYRLTTFNYPMLQKKVIEWALLKEFPGKAVTLDNIHTRIPTLVTFS